MSNFGGTAALIISTLGLQVPISNNRLPCQNSSSIFDCLKFQLKLSQSYREPVSILLFARSADSSNF